jgi:trimeric autotransporter adhesin
MFFVVPPEIIQPGQAVFVKKANTGSTATLTIAETHKVVAQGTAGVFRNSYQSNDIGLIRANLQANINNQWQTTDAALALFGDNYSWDVTQEDASKMNNLDEEVSFVQNNTSLAIAKQNDASVTDELPIRLQQLRHTNYRWVFDLTNYNGNTPYLLDTEQNTLSVIEEGTVLPFTAGSTTSNRFKIIFQSPLSTPDFTKQIVLYPNPGKKDSSFYLAGISSASVRLYNVLGQEIPVQSQANGQTLQVTPKTSLSTGVYNVHITQDGTTAQVKWIVE